MIRHAQSVAGPEPYDMEAAPGRAVLRQVLTHPDDAPMLLGRVYARAVPTTATTLGRDLRNGVVLLDPAVSREHARLIQLADGGWDVENISQSNILWAEGRALRPGERLPLASGAILRLGDTTLQFLAPSTDSADAGTDAMHPASSSPGAGATNLLNPGITLQFAFAGRRGPRFWWALGGAGICGVLISAVITLGAAALVGRNALALGGLGHVLGAVTIPLVPAIGVAVLVAAIDRYEREPWLLLAAAFLWGAVIAVPPALGLERALDSFLPAALTTGTPTLGEMAVVAGAHAFGTSLVEECVKGAGLLLLLLAVRDEFDNVTDGILYGLLIGGGFAMVENFVYFALSPRADLPALLLGRVVLGWLSHSTFTALLGAGLGYAREAHHRSNRWRFPLAGFVAAVLLHTYFDTVLLTANAAAQTSWIAQIPGIVALLAAYLPLFAAQAVLLRLALAALRREAEVIRKYLSGEVHTDTITPDEYVLAQSAALRDAVERQSLFVGGPRVYLTTRELYQTMTGLAFRKWHVAQGDPPKPAERQPEDAYRERIKTLRRSLQRQLAKAVPATTPRERG